MPWDDVPSFNQSSAFKHVALPHFSLPRSCDGERARSYVYVFVCVRLVSLHVCPFILGHVSESNNVDIFKVFTYLAQMPSRRGMLVYTLSST